MEKHLITKLVVATIILLTLIQFIGFINTCIGLFYAALTLFLAGLLYICYKALKDAVQETEGGINSNEQ
jgi:hypothetical protein